MKWKIICDVIRSWASFFSCEQTKFSILIQFEYKVFEEDDILFIGLKWIKMSGKRTEKKTQINLILICFKNKQIQCFNN